MINQIKYSSSKTQVIKEGNRMAKGVINKRIVKKNNRKTNKSKKKKRISLGNKIRGIINYLKSDFYLYSYSVSSSSSTDYSTLHHVQKSVVAAADLTRATNTVLPEHVDLQTNKEMQNNSVGDELGDLGKGGVGDKHGHGVNEDQGNGGRIMHDIIGDEQEHIVKDGLIQNSRGDKQGDYGTPSSPDEVFISPSIMTMRPGRMKAAPRSMHLNGRRTKPARAQASNVVLSPG